MPASHFRLETAHCGSAAHVRRKALLQSAWIRELSDDVFQFLIL